MKKKITLVLVITFLAGISMQMHAQTTQGNGYAKSVNEGTYGYCLTGLDLSPELQAKIAKMQKDHQAAMAPLRTKLQGTRDWAVKNEMRAQMNALKAKHQEEIWTLVPASRGKSLNLRQGTGRGQGYPGQGLGRAAGGRGLNQGIGRGAGRGAGRGIGRGVGRGGGRGVGTGVGSRAGSGAGTGGGRRY